MITRRPYLLLGMVMLFALAACNPNPQPAGLTPIPTLAPGSTPTLVSALQSAPAAIPVPASQGQAALGAPIYLEQCSACHGDQGEGSDSPALRNSAFIKSGDQAVFETIASGRPGTMMPAWLQANGGPLTSDNINNVVAYLHTLQDVPPLPRATPIPPALTEIPAGPGAPTAEPARPSLPGGLGPAASLIGDVTRGQPAFGLYCAVCHGPEGFTGIPNPDSDDGSVPPLNPIDPTIANSDPKAFAANLDLFVEHGSIPSGPAPQILMPAFGDSKLLEPQTLADIIAYVMHLNGVDQK